MWEPARGGEGAFSRRLGFSWGWQPRPGLTKSLTYSSVPLNQERRCPPLKAPVRTRPDPSSIGTPTVSFRQSLPNSESQLHRNIVTHKRHCPPRGVCGVKPRSGFQSGGSLDPGTPSPNSGGGGAFNVPLSRDRGNSEPLALASIHISLFPRHILCRTAPSPGPNDSVLMCPVPVYLWCCCV